MKVLQQIIFTCAMIVGLSVAVSAQKDEQKKPPKPPPPVITPHPKPPPSEDNKPKKPEYGLVIGIRGRSDTV